MTVPTFVFVGVLVVLALASLLMYEVRGHRRRQQRAASRTEHRTSNDPPPGDGFHANHSAL